MRDYARALSRRVAGALMVAGAGAAGGLIAKLDNLTGLPDDLHTVIGIIGGIILTNVLPSIKQIGQRWEQTEIPDA